VSSARSTDLEPTIELPSRPELQEILDQLDRRVAVAELDGTHTPAANATDEAGDDAVTLDQRRLNELLGTLAIPLDVRPYPAHDSVEEGRRLRGDLPGVFAKNLLLRDKKNNLFFITAHEDTQIDLKTLHTQIGGRGRLGFASTETLWEVLGVEPGTATPMSMINDTEDQVTLVVDQRLMDADLLNFSPLAHTQTLRITPQNFDRFLRACGKDPLVLDLAAASRDGQSG
jgi:Ala-tRNA(Pro) deacylase